MYAFSLPPFADYHKTPVEKVFEVDETRKRARLDSHLFVGGTTITDHLTVQNTENDAQLDVKGTKAPQLTIENPDNASIAQLKLKSGTGSGTLGINASNDLVLSNSNSAKKIVLSNETSLQWNRLKLNATQGELHRSWVPTYPDKNFTRESYDT
jgi:hypothetical protein